MFDGFLRRFTGLITILLGCVVGPLAHALDPAAPPGENFDLSHWYLGLPVDASGGTTGKSASIPAARLAAGYVHPEYFKTGADGAMVFWAPVTGATTSGSSYPRSELREQISPPSNTVNWRGFGIHTLTAVCKVLEVPSKEKVIIGQIHSKTGNTRPLVKLQYRSGRIEALIKKSPNADPDAKLQFQQVGLDSPVSYIIRMQDGLVTVEVNGMRQTMDVFDSDPDWAHQEFYFKAGSYCQDNTGPPTEGARVAFYSLVATHEDTPDVVGGTYQEVVTAQNPAHHYQLDASLADASGGGPDLDPTGPSGRFVEDAIGNAQSAWSYSASTDALVSTADLFNGGGPGADPSATGTGTISFQFRMLDDTNNTGQRYLFSQGGTSGTRNQLALFIENDNKANGSPNSLKLRVGNGPTTAILPPAELVPGAWHYFAMTYNEARDNDPGEVLWYAGSAGGTLRSGAINIGNDAVVGDNGPIAVGNRMASGNVGTSGFRNPGSGAVDEFAVWRYELSEGQVAAQFDAVLVPPAAPPGLNITLSGTDVVLHWKQDGAAGYMLESTQGLTPPAWKPIDQMPSVIGNSYWVTNAPGEDHRYYRLRKP